MATPSPRFNGSSEFQVQLEARSELQSHHEQSCQTLENVLHEAIRESWSKFTGKRRFAWYGVKDAGERFADCFREHYTFWKIRGECQLLSQYLDIVKDMINLVAFELSKKYPDHRNVKVLCSGFPRTLNYLQQENFKAQGALNWLKPFETARAVLIHVRAFKNMQLQRFKTFRLTLSKNKAKKRGSLRKWREGKREKPSRRQRS